MGGIFVVVYYVVLVPLLFGIGWEMCIDPARFVIPEAPVALLRYAGAIVLLNLGLVALLAPVLGWLGVISPDYPNDTALNRARTNAVLLALTAPAWLLLSFYLCRCTQSTYAALVGVCMSLLLLVSLAGYGLQRRKLQAACRNT